MNPVIGRLAAILGTTLAACGPAFAGSYVVTTIDPPGSIDTLPMAINKDGLIVGHFVENRNGVQVTHGFVWSNGVFTVVDGSANALYTTLNAVNDHGVAVGTYSETDTGPGLRPLTYRIADGRVGRPNLGIIGAFLDDIDDSGVAVGSYLSTGDLYRGFELRDGVVTTVQPPKQTDNSILFNIANNGTGLGYFQHAGREDVTYFTYAAGKATPIPLPAHTHEGTVVSQSNGGLVVGHVVPNGFVSDGSTIEYFSFPGARSTFPTAINQRGDILGYFFYQSGVARYFLRRLGKYHKLNLPTGTDFLIMNNNETIAGRYPQGAVEHGFVAICPPDQRPCTR